MKLKVIISVVCTILILFIKVIKTIEILELNNFKNVYEMYPYSSNSDECLFGEIRFLVKDSDINGGILSLTSNGPFQLTHDILKSEGPCSIYKLTSIQNNLQQGETLFQFNATSLSFVSTVVYFNFTCNKPDYSNLNIIKTTSNLIFNGINYCAPVQIVGINFNISNLKSQFNGIPDIIPTPGVRNFFCVQIYSDSLIETPSSGFYFKHLFYIDNVFGIKEITIIYSTNPFMGKTNLISDVTSYPTNNSLGLVEISGYGLSPLITFKSNSNDPFQYISTPSTKIVPIPSYGNKGNLTYIVAFIGLQNDQEVINSLEFFDLGMKNQNLITSVKLFNISNIPQINIITNDSYTDIPLHQQSTIIVNYNYFSMIFRYGQNIVQLYWPFGFKSGNNYQLNYSFDFQQAQLESLISLNFCGNIYLSFLQSCVPISPVEISSDSIPPKIESYQFIHLIDEVYRLIISVVDEGGVSSIKSASFLPSSSGSLSASLISGDIYNGTYEFLCNTNLFMTLYLTDVYQNTITITEGTYISLDTDGSFLQYILPKQLQNRQFTYSNIQSVSFEYNDLNLIENGDSFNTMYIVSNDIPIDTNMFVVFMDPLSYTAESISIIYWPFRYDSNTSRFICDFVIPKNTVFGKMGYLIQITPRCLVYNDELPDNFQLNIIDSYLDNSPPLFKNFIKVYGQSGNQFNYTLIGWSFEIEDNVGFNYGYIKVVGTIDNSIYNFNFTSHDSNNGVFEILINTTNPCISQSYKIIYVELYDINNVYSMFEMYPTIAIKQTKNPFRYYFDQVDIMDIPFICPNLNLLDVTAPVLTAFISSLPNGSVAVNSNNRYISFEFQLEDLDSGIKISQLPIIYIQSSKFELQECISKLLWSQDKIAGYSCEVELPFGFGYPGILTFSIYGLINNNGYFGGYSTLDLLSLFNVHSYVNTSVVLDTFGLSPTIISNHRVTSKGGRLILYGNSFENVIGVTITFLDDIYGYNVSFTPTIVNPTSIIIDNIPITTKPYIVILNTPNVKSNDYKVVPIYFNTTFIQPTPSITLSPTPSPIGNKCIGNPECGGKDNGYCNSNLICVCYPPWVGIDCLSKVIIVPKPNTNNTNPSIEIPIIDNGGDVTKYLFKSLILLVSIRELDYKFEPVNSFTFDKWIFTEINSKKNQYFTNITIIDSLNNHIIGITNITVYIEWFDKLTIVEFASSNLTMNPSTVKYTFEITKYPFKSNLNHLQLIMSASFKSSIQNTCSINSFGEISNGGDNYLKIQIDDHSLNGRFINRAIIDSKFETISNKLLDSSFNEITNSAGTTQTYIGINLPKYDVSAIMDPDFSILFDSKTASNYEDSICESSSKLTSSQLAGIIIGSIAFAAIIVISVSYYIVKKKQISKFTKSLKLKGIE